MRLQYFTLAHWLSGVDIRRMHPTLLLERAPNYPCQTQPLAGLHEPRDPGLPKLSTHQQVLIEGHHLAPLLSVTRRRNRDLDFPHSRSAGKVELACNPRYHRYMTKSAVSSVSSRLSSVWLNQTLCHPRICVRGSPSSKIRQPEPMIPDKIKMRWGLDLPVRPKW